jgi:hypothetical protein
MADNCSLPVIPPIPIPLPPTSLTDFINLIKDSLSYFSGIPIPSLPPCPF